jgi:hypothetical protein
VFSKRPSVAFHATTSPSAKVARFTISSSAKLDPKVGRTKTSPTVVLFVTTNATEIFQLGAVGIVAVSAPALSGSTKRISASSKAFVFMPLIFPNSVTNPSVSSGIVSVAKPRTILEGSAGNNGSGIRLAGAINIRPDIPTVPTAITAVPLGILEPL